MALHWTCPQGHEWEFGEEVQPGQTLLCPVCGMGLGLPPPPQLPLPTIDIAESGDPHQTPAERSSPTAADQPPGRPPELDKPSTQPPRRRGHFTILQPHAKGGLGKVSIARDEELQRDVALKEIRSRYADDPSNQERFRAEAMITGRLEHPGIVPVYALGRDERGRPYYAMRFVHGRTLHDAIRDYHALPTPLEFHQLLRHFNYICQAVGYAHSQGVLHRDLKPSNVMLGEYGETLVLDWGLAKQTITDVRGGIKTEANAKASDSSFLLALSSLTQAGQVLGTPAYMSPEQAQADHERIGPATDIYALGCILFEILTGRPPFDELTTANVLERKIKEPPPVPSHIKPGVPRPLEAICRKAMAREPEARYATPVALAQDVERWLADEKVLADAEPWLARASRWARRHKPLVAATAVLLVVATIALAISNALVRREQKETETARQQAVEERNRALARFHIANETLDRMLQRMGHYRLALVTQMDLKSDPARWGLLLDAQRFYEKFVEERGDDPGLQRDLALAHRRLGDIHRMRGDHGAAQQAYERAIAVLNEISDVPRTGWRVADLAECHHDLGLLCYLTDRTQDAERHYRAALQCYEEQDNGTSDFQSLTPEGRQGVLALARTHHQFALLLRDTGRAREAREHFRKAGEIREKLGALNPDNHDIWRAVAQTHIDHAHLLASLHQEVEAERLARRAVELLTRHVGALQSGGDAHPDLVEYRHELAGSLNNLGLVLASRMPTEAEKAYEKSLTIRDQLARAFRTRPDFRYELALCRLNRGVLYFDTERAAQAELEWIQAREMLERLVSDFEEAPIYASRLGQVLNNLAAVCDQRGDLVAARELLEAAITQQRKAWQSNRQHPEYRTQLSNHLAGLADVLLRLGLHAEVARTASEMPAVAPEAAAEYRRAAGFLARAMKVVLDSQAMKAEERERISREYGARAVACLRSAMERGFADPANLKQAEDLEALRRHPDFLKLVDELERTQKTRPAS